VIRLKSSCAELSSSRLRSAGESKILQEQGNAVRIYQLQGNLSFSTTEVLIKDVMDGLSTTRVLVFDLKRVLSANESACRFLYRLLEKIRLACCTAVFAQSGHLPELRRYMKTRLSHEFETAYLAMEDLDLALEWAENQILTQAMAGWSSGARAPRSSYELFKGLSPAQVETLGPYLKPRLYRKGESIIHGGEQADHLFFLATGTVSVLAQDNESIPRRIATFSAGMTFGEMAVLDRAPRSAMIVADTDVECDLLSVEDFERFGQTHVEVKSALLENLALQLALRLRKANRRMAALE
jgi:glutaminase